MRHSRRYDFQGHSRSGSRWGDDLSPLLDYFVIFVLCFFFSLTLPLLSRLHYTVYAFTIHVQRRPMIVFHSFYILVPSGHKKWGCVSYFQKVRESGPPSHKVMPLSTHDKYLLQGWAMATVDMHRKFGEVWQVVFEICQPTYKTNTHSVKMCSYL